MPEDFTLGAMVYPGQAGTLSHLAQLLQWRHSSLGQLQLAERYCLGSLISPDMSLQPECVVFPALQAVLEEAASCGTCYKDRWSLPM